MQSLPQAAGDDPGKTRDNAWLAQARTLREAVRLDLADATAALRTAVRKTAAALEKLDALEREGEGR
jgi:uncharacterized protein YfaQ (DUF2300 family)